MNDLQYIATTTLAVKLMALAIGGLCIFAGYRLLALGIFPSGSDLNITFGKNGLLLKKAAPGTIFALLGVALISIALVFAPQTRYSEEASAGSSVPSNMHDILRKVSKAENLSGSEEYALAVWAKTIVDAHDKSSRKSEVNFQNDTGKKQFIR
jgi:hypothetical protein